MKFVRKAIFNQEGKKVLGARQGKLQLGAVDEDDFVTNLTWKEWKSLKVPYKGIESVEKRFIAGLLKQENQFNKKVDLNGKLRDAKTFEQKVDILLNGSSKIKYTKSGLKESLDEMEVGVNTTNASSTDALKGDFKPSGKFNNTPYFECDPATFHNCVAGKKKGKHWSKFLGGPFGENVKKWVASNRNSNFMLKNSEDNSYIYAHRSF
jgi:hypothetical protein